MNGYIEEMMEGQKVVKVFTHEQQTLDGFRQLNDQLKESSKQANAFSNIMILSTPSWATSATPCARWWVPPWLWAALAA